jgi:folate-binding protein YgfZ
MANPSPLMAPHEAHGVQPMPFGADVTVAAVHDIVETEYGRLRNRAAVMDCPHRALVEVTGGDRRDFLHRMLTNDGAPDRAAVQAGHAIRQFLLDREGHIMADAMQIDSDGRTWLDTDVYSAAGLVAELDRMLFGEDVQWRDVTSRWHRLSLHGPNAERIAGRYRDAALVFPHEQCGVPGWHVWMDAARVAEAWEALTGGEDPPAKPLGWLAFNMARIEAGTPLYRVDFGPDSIPNETGILQQAVSNTKGCFRGQEIVARIRDRGHPAKILVAIESVTDQLPIAGEPVFAEPAYGKPIGAVTSSAPSPLRSGKPIGMAMVKWGCHEPGTELYTPVQGGTAPIITAALASA